MSADDPRDAREAERTELEQVGPEPVDESTVATPSGPDEATLRQWLADAMDDFPSTVGRRRRQLMRRGLEALVGIAANESNHLETKIVTQALDELAVAFRRFAPHRHRRKVAIFGSARTKPGTPGYDTAKDLAAALVQDGFMIITGAGPGVMQAGNEGAGREHSFGLNIDLPFEQSANPFIDGDPKHVDFRYFFTRKLVFVKEASAIVACPGGFGTQDEIFEALTLLQTGRSEVVPVVLFQPPGDAYWDNWLQYVQAELLEAGLISEADLELFDVANSVDEARQLIARFYLRYHSSRYVGPNLLIRLKSELPPSGIQRLNDEFVSILRPDQGGIRATGPILPAEQDVPELHDLPRLLVPFNRHDYGRLKAMIGVINEM